jgi:hypothetical protein
MEKHVRKKYKESLSLATFVYKGVANAFDILMANSITSRILNKLRDFYARVENLNGTPAHTGALHNVDSFTRVDNLYTSLLIVIPY